MVRSVVIVAAIGFATGCAGAPSGEVGGQSTAESRLVQFLGRRSLLPLSDEKGKFGYSTRSGQTAIPPTFGRADEFMEGRALVCVGGCNYVKRQESDSVTVHEFQGKFGFIDEKGSFIGEPRFDSGEAFSEGLAAVCLGRGCRDFKVGERPDGLEERWGFVNRSGQIVINPQFEWVGSFSEGLAPFCSSSCDDRSTRRVGFIDARGNAIVAAQFTSAEGYWDGISQVAIGRGSDRRVGYINQKGEYVMLPRLWPE